MGHFLLAREREPIGQGAAQMVPVRYDTFAHGIDAPGRAVEVLSEAMVAMGIGEDRVRVLAIGAQLTVVLVSAQ